MRTTLAVFALCLLAVGCFAQTSTVVRNKFFTWNGGFAGCSNCGSPVTQFACSNGIGNWANGYQSFSLYDIPVGYVLTEVRVDLTGTYSCSPSAYSLVNVTVNNVVIDTKTVWGSSGCTCNSCDGVKTFSNKFFTRGFPGKISGANNYLQITAGASPICLASANLTMTFAVPDQKSVSFTLFPNVNNTIDKVCTGCGQSNNASALSNPSTVDFYFKDPLPAGKTLIAIGARVYGRWPNLWGSSGQVSMSLTGTVISSRTIPSREFSNDACNYCSGGLDWFSNTYMFGWPNYLNGGNNLLRIFQSYTSSQYAISSVAVTLTYI